MEIKLVRYFFKVLMGIASILLFNCTANSQYKQVRIPLSNENGVPYFKENNFFYLDGFEVDEKGNYYFLGGEKATLVHTSGISINFRKSYDEFNSGQIYLLKDKLYLFDNSYKRNNLIAIDTSNGEIVSRYSCIIKNAVSTFVLRDSSLIMEVFDNKKTINMSTERGYVLFNLRGQYVKQVENFYNLPKKLYPKEFYINAMLYLGEWGNGYLFCKPDIDTKSIKFMMLDSEGNLLHSKNVDDNNFGRFFFGHPYEFERLRNGKIYILSRDEKNAIVTILPIKELFNLN